MAVIVLDPELRVRSFNPAATRLFGQNVAGLAGRSGQNLFANARDFDALSGSRFGLRPDRPETQFVGRYRTLGGRVFDGETVAVFVDDPTGGAAADIMLAVRDVSGELSLKAKLEASDIQLRAALASANEGAFSLNLVTGLGSTRGFINDFLGIASTDATISLERWLDTVDPNMRDRVAAAIDALRDRPTASLDVTYRARRADGEWRWLHMRGRVTEFTREGPPLRISGVVADISERQALEDKLADRERQLANAIEAGSCGVWELRPDTMRVTPIGPIRAMLGLPDEPEEIDGQVWLDRTHPDQRDEVARQIEAVAAGQTDTMDTEYRLLDARTDSWIWLRSRGRLMPSEDGRMIAAGIITDISERKQLEQQVAISQDLLQEAYESANTGAWSFDLVRNRVRLSGFVVRLLGLGGNEADLSFDAWLDRAPPGDTDRVHEVLDAVKSATRDTDPAVINGLFGDFPMIAKDGSEVWLRTQGRVVDWTPDGHPARLTGMISDITEEHRLETALRRSESRLRDALKAANEGAWRLDLHSQVAEITAVIAEMMGLPSRDARISYNDWLERVHPDDLHICTACYETLVSGESDHVDYVVRYRSESQDWIHIHNRGRISQRDDQGRPAIATGFITDISERVRTEAALQARDQQLSEAVEAASIGTWRRSYKDDTVTFRGSLVPELFAAGTEITLPMSDWYAHVHPDDRDNLKDIASRAIAGELRTADYEYRLKNHKGEWVWYRNIGSVVEFDQDGRPVVSSGVIWNIDSARRADREHDEKRERFERIYRATPAMMHTIDPDGYIVEVSDYWLTYLGYERDEVVGRKSIDFLDAESRRRAVEISLPYLFKYGANTNVPYRFLRKDGSGIDVLLSSFLERDRDGRPLRSYAVMTDVTQLREANEMLERSNRELDRFATVASHDLQEPLRKIAAFAGLLQRRYTDAFDEDGTRHLEFLVDAAHRMQRLIDDLLAYSRLASQPIDRKPVDVSEALRQAVEQLETAIAESGAIIRPGTLPTVEADRTLLIQILQNLVSNAVKYRAEDKAPEIGIAAERRDGLWIFAVSDNGIGLDEKFSEKIFAPFQRLHSREAYRGTGIGLAIVRQAVERHGGDVWVESQPGEGATFFFSLPAAGRETEIPPDVSEHAAK
jgi:PAS domain S-box-containing protein